MLAERSNVSLKQELADERSRCDQLTMQVSAIYCTKCYISLGGEV